MLDDEMLTIDDLAAYLKLRPQTIYKWAQTGRIPGAKFGKEWRFRSSSIEQWIDSRIRSFEEAASPSPPGAGGKAAGPEAEDANGRAPSTEQKSGTNGDHHKPLGSGPERARQPSKRVGFLFPRGSKKKARPRKARKARSRKGRSPEG